MSNDQPTERFDAQNDDAPTVRFEPAAGMPPGGTPPPPSGGPPAGGPPAGGPPAEPPADPERKSRTLIIVLAIVAGLVLIAVVIALTLLFTRSSGDPVSVLPTATPSATASESPSPEPSTSPAEEPAPAPEPTTAPPPATASPSFATFSAPTTSGCTVANPESRMTFSWSSTDATTAWFGVRTLNAKEGPYEEVPTTATYYFNYQCGQESEYYTVTLEDAAGNLTHKTVTITKE